MNLTDFLLMKNGNTVKPDADLVDILLAKKLGGGAGVITTLTGNPLSFLVKKAQKAISTKISMSPIQEGTGDPSPTNIRPISGRTSVSLNGIGKNLFDKDNSDNILKLYIGTGTNVLVNVSTNRSVCIKCKPNTTYTISKKVSERFLVGYVTEVPANGVRCYEVVRDDTATSLTITTGDDALYIVAYIAGSNESTASKFNAILNTVQIELGSSATEYESYQQSNDVTITFGETVYGGTLDVETGVLTVDKGIVDIGTLIWTRTTAYVNPVFLADVSDIKSSEDARLLSDTYKARDAAYLGASGFAAAANNCECAGSRSTTLRCVYLRDDAYTSATDLARGMSGHYIIYPLETPITIQLTPEQIQILKGQNTIWIEDEGAQIELTYRA